MLPKALSRRFPRDIDEDVRDRVRALATTEAFERSRYCPDQSVLQQNRGKSGRPEAAAQPFLGSDNRTGHRTVPVLHR